MERQVDPPFQPQDPEEAGAPQPPRPLLITLGSVYSVFMGVMFIATAAVFASTGSANWSLNNKVVHGPEPMVVAALLAIFGASMTGIGYGLFTHRSWARRAALALPIVLGVAAAAASRSAADLKMDVVSAALVIGIPLWYFYEKRSVVAYYAAVAESGRRGERYAPPAPRRNTWWRRNWPWALAGGLVFFTILFFAIINSFKSNRAYLDAVRMASSDSRVIAAIGTPVVPGYFPGGNVQTNWGGHGTSGTAYFDIPLSGPRGEGSLSVEALRDSAGWRITRLVFTGAARTDTLVAASAPMSTAPPSPRP